MPVNVEHGTNQGACGKAQDKQHREGTVWHILRHSVNPERAGRQAHGLEQGAPVFLLDPPPETAPQNRAG